MKSCTPLWREAHFEVKMVKTPGVRTTFGSCDVEKVHAVLARSTFPSQNVQSTPCYHFWKVRYRKSTRPCGAKHISKSKCTKHTMLGPLLEVQMSKKWTPLWRETHFQVKIYRAIFGGSDVEKMHAVVVRSTFPSQNIQSTSCSRRFRGFRRRKSARRCGAKHISKTQKLPSTTLHFTTLHNTTLHYTSTTTTTTQLHSTTLHYTTLHFTTLHYTTLPSTTLHYLPLHFTTLHYTTIDYTTNTTTTTQLHSITLHYTTLH